MRFHFGPSWLRAFLFLSSVAFNVVLVGFIVNFVQVEQATAFPRYIFKHGCVEKCFFYHTQPTSVV